MMPVTVYPFKLEICKCIHIPRSRAKPWPWYYHLAYTWAIYVLNDRGAIIIPPEHYSGIVMYREGPEGLLSK